MQKQCSMVCPKYIISSSVGEQKVSYAKGHVAKLCVQRVLSVLPKSTLDAVLQRSLQIVGISSKRRLFLSRHT